MDLNTHGETLFNEKKFDEAYDCFTMALEQDNNDGRAMNNLGMYYEEFVGIDNIAVSYYKRAIDAESVPAMLNLGKYYVNKQSFKAEKYFRMALEHNNPEALHNLAVLYMNHNMYDNAIEFFKMSVECGNVESMYELGVYYSVNDIVEAEKYFLMAVNLNSINAMIGIASLYQTHDNNNEACKYYALAIDNGCLMVENNLNNIFRKTADLQLMSEYYNYLPSDVKQKFIAAVASSKIKNARDKY
jgi:TPR repeat protein